MYFNFVDYLLYLNGDKALRLCRNRNCYFNLYWNNRFVNDFIKNMNLACYKRTQVKRRHHYYAVITYWSLQSKRSKKYWMLYLKAGELHLVHPTKFCVCNTVVSNSNMNSMSQLHYILRHPSQPLPLFRITHTAYKWPTR